MSGKGIPAAMLMMQSKTLLKSCAESGLSIEQVFTTNEKLCEGNEADMFVTAWMGLLNVKTGHVNFDVTPHQLRHTYITNLIHSGVDPKTVQYLAGHENSKMTMDIYAKVKYNNPEELLAVVNSAFGQPSAPQKKKKRA